MKWIPLKERLVSEKTINRNAKEMAVACIHVHNGVTLLW